MTRDDFNEYVRQQSRKLYGYAFRILRNQEEAEDAVQEVFIKLWKMKEKLDEYKSIDALATTVIKNYCIDQIRRQKNLQKTGTENLELNNIEFPSPHRLMEIKESTEIINNIIGNLEEKIRKVVRLREIEELSYEEISDITGLNINTLRVILSRARCTIRDEYNKYTNEKRRVKFTS
jgi:RNA polymerase sigma-70 factor (ECF subfamily)